MSLSDCESYIIAKYSCLLREIDRVDRELSRLQQLQEIYGLVNKPLITKLDTGQVDPKIKTDSSKIYTDSSLSNGQTQTSNHRSAVSR